MRFLNASQTVAFTGAGGERGRIVMELEAIVFGDGTYPIRIFPHDVDRVVASVGTVSFEGARDLRRTYEPLGFSNSDRARLKYPATGGATITPVGTLFDAQGGVVSPHLWYDPDEDYVRAPFPILGAVTVDYTARYLRVFYRPVSSALRRDTQFGTVFAFKNGVVESLAIDLEYEESTDYTELYSVISYAVVKGDTQERISDVWEKPPGWPEENRYPGIGTAGPDPDESVTVQRTHERAFVSQRGDYQARPVFVPIEQPYQGVPSYRPEYELQRRSAPSEEFGQAFADAPWDRIIAALKKRYPGITGVGED